jgi:hypothetical protein
VEADIEALDPYRKPFGKTDMSPAIPRRYDRRTGGGAAAGMALVRRALTVSAVRLALKCYAVVLAALGVVVFVAAFAFFLLEAIWLQLLRSFPRARPPADDEPMRLVRYRGRMYVCGEGRWIRVYRVEEAIRVIRDTPIA